MININIITVLVSICNVIMFINYVYDIKKIHVLENTIALMDGARASRFSLYNVKIECLSKRNDKLLEEIQLLKGEK